MVLKMCEFWDYESLVENAYYHTTTILWPFFWDYPGELVPEENF